MAQEKQVFLNDSEMPYSLEAEQTILGAIFIEPEVLSVVLEHIKPEYFFVNQHRELFRIIVQMFTSGERADTVTVLNEAVAQHVFETAQEGRKYIFDLAEFVPSVENIQSYCNIVSSRYYIRTLAKVAREILQDIANGETNAQLLLDSTEQKIFNIRQGREVSGLTPLHEVVTETYNHIAKMVGAERNKYIGLNTGFSYLDAVISGLNKSDLVLLAARPAMGKTAFALNIAMNVAQHNRDKSVCIFSLEMSKQQLASRLLSTASHVDSHKLRTGRINPGDDWEKLANGACYLYSLPILIDDTGGITIPQMKAKLRRVKNLGLVVIDYLGLISSTMRTENRVQVVSEMTRQLKIMAKELDVPVLLLSQLSRGPEGRTDKRPILADLRESGSIEQDADIVMFLYRDAYYNKASETPNIAECIIAKNRHGETGTINLVWNGQYTEFTTLETKQNEPK